MSKTLAFIKKEFLELIPPTIFFFIVFEIVVGARSLMGSETNLSLTTTAAAVIGALIVGKSILIIDVLPLFNWFRGKPLILDSLWRLFLYMSLVLVFQFLEELIPLARKYDGVAAGFSHLSEEVHWPRFVATHAMLAVFLGIYCVMSNLVRLTGGDRVREAFFRNNHPGS